MRKNLLFILVLAFFSHVLIGQSRVPSSNQRLTSNRLTLDAEATGNPFVKTSLKLALIDQNGGKTSVQTTDFKLKEANPETDPYGLQHYHYTQTINGIEVDGAEMRVHVKNGMVESQTGSWLLEVTPRLQAMRASQTADAILQAVEASLKGKKISSQTLTTTPIGNNANARTAALPDNAKLVYVPMGRNFEAISPDSVRLAYRFTVKTGAFSNFMYYVDATNGEVLYKIDLVCRMIGAKAHIHTASCESTAAAIAPPMPTLAPPPPVTESIDANSVIWTRYSGSQKTITTKRSDGKWSLKDLNRGIDILHLDSLIFDDNGKPKQEYSSFYFNNSNQWRLKSENDFDAFARDAFWGAQVTKDFYIQKMGGWLYQTISYGRDLKIYANTDFSILDPNATNSVNAFFSGDEVVIGQGTVDYGINPLSPLDVVAHEITHGVTAGTSGLRYINESGAINEALSDIFGTAVERYKRPERWNWTVGEDCGIIIRSMSNPRAYEQPSEYGGKYFLNYLTDYDVDNGGVHVNSGVVNRWFYLLCVGGKGKTEAGNAYDVAAIGMDDALKIIYLAQKDYITPGMSMYTASLGFFRAARAIFGADAVQTKQVINAWKAVNVSKEDISLMCSDTHEPNNSAKAATKIAANTKIYGNMEDFAKSPYNRGDLFHDQLPVPNDEIYHDWYVLTTTADKPNLQVLFKQYFLDAMNITIYKDHIGDNFKWVSFETSETSARKYFLYSNEEDPKTLQTEFVVPPINDVKPHTYYIRVAHGLLGEFRGQAIAALSNGCYELTANVSAKPFPVTIRVNQSYEYNRNLINNQFFTLINLDQDETKFYKVMSLADDKQMQAGVPVIQRDYDNRGDQIWQFVEIEQSVNQNVYKSRFVLKNLNTDKVIETDTKGRAYQAAMTKASSQKFNPGSGGLTFNSAWVIGDDEGYGGKYLTVNDTVNRSAVVLKPAIECQDGKPCRFGSQDWAFLGANLPDEGEYIIRSVKDKQALSFPAGKSLQVKPYTEGVEQRWKATYNKDGRYVLTNSQGGLALNLPNANPVDAATYNLQAANKNVETQNWKLLPSGPDGSFKIANTTNNKTVSARSNGAVQYTYTGSEYQRWYLDKVQTLKTGYYSIKNRATGLYMDVPGADKTNGAKLITYPNNGAYNQLFYVQAQPDGSYVIENVTSEKALSTNTTDNDSQLYQWETDVNKPNHKWRIVYTTDGYFKVISTFNGKAVQAGKNASAAGKGSPLVQENYQLNNFYQQWNFRILGTPEDKTVQTLAQTTESISAESTAGLTIFPNPAQNQVTVVYDLAEGEQAEVKLMSLTGMELKSQPAEAKQTVVDVSAFGTGVYLINLKTNSGKRLIQKLIISK